MAASSAIRSDSRAVVDQAAFAVVGQLAASPFDGPPLDPLDLASIERIQDSGPGEHLEPPDDLGPPVDFVAELASGSEDLDLQTGLLEDFANRRGLEVLSGIELALRQATIAVPTAEDDR